MNFFSDFAFKDGDMRTVINLLIGLVAGIVIAGGYIFGRKGKNFSKQFVITLVLLPIIVAFIIPIISTDLKKAVSLAGIFTLVRFRSVPGDSKDILYVFFTLAVGIAVGLNYYAVAAILVILITVLFILLEKNMNFAEPQVLKITVPENMNYKDAFDDIFDKYLAKHSVKEVRTTNMGTLFNISYDVRFKKDADVKACFDEIRTRNGNLNIVLQSLDESETNRL